MNARPATIWIPRDRMVNGWMERLERLTGLRADLAAMALGLVAALALPPLHLVPALAVAIPGLLGLMDAAPNAVAAGRRGWWFGFGLNLAGLYWVTEAILFEAARYWWLIPLAAPALASVMAVFVALAVWLAHRFAAGLARVLILCAAWVLLDIARQFVASGFPWNPLGSVWAIPGWAGDVMIQPAAWVGVHGLTLATLLLAAAPRFGRAGLAAGAALMIGWAGLGGWRVGHAAVAAAPGPTVIVIQGNIPQGQKWNRERAIAIFSQYLNQTAEAVARAGSGPLVVIWPETASPFPLEIDQAAREAISDAAGGHPALIGGVRFDDAGRPRNALFAVLAGGVVASIYDKWHLVPFGEYQPSWLPLGIQLVPGGGFAAGPGPRTLLVPGVPPFGPMICYEAIFPGEVVDFEDRPHWLVNVTNDAWFGNSSGPRQHLTSSRLRSVEEGLPLVRAANTGISAGFDAYGHELGRIGLNATGTYVVPLPAAIAATVFARAGLWVPVTLCVLTFAAGGMAAFRRKSQ